MAKQRRRERILLAQRVRPPPELQPPPIGGAQKAAPLRPMYITEVPSGGGAFRWWHDERLMGGSGGSGSGGAASAAAHGEPSWPEARVVDGMLAALRGVPSGPFALPGDGGAPSFSVDARVRLESVSPSALHSALALIAAAGTRAARLDALATR